MIATKIQKLKTIPRLTSFRTFLLPRRSLSSHNLPTGKSWTRNHPWSDSFRSPPKRDFSSRLNKLFIFTARLRTAKKLPCGQKIELLASTSSSAAAKPSRSITRRGRVSPLANQTKNPLSKTTDGLCFQFQVLIRFGSIESSPQNKFLIQHGCCGRRPPSKGWCWGLHLKFPADLC